MSQLRITFIASTLRMGGAERGTFELARRLAGDGDLVDAVCLRERGAVGDMMADAGIPVRTHVATGARDPRAFTRLLGHLKHRRSDAVYFLDHTNAVFWGAPAARLAGVGVRVMVMHTTGLWGGGSSLPGGVRSGLPFLNGVIATARGQERYLADLGVPAHKLVTIRNGVEVPHPGPADDREAVRHELGLGPNDLAVGMIAMFRPEKAHEILFESVRRIRDDFPGLRIFLVGDGPRREELVTEVDRMGLGGVVTFLGLRSDAPRLATAFDVVVLTSYPLVETLPYSLLEAMGQGVPAVATRVGSLPELVEEGGAGVLVPPGDAGAFADALAGVLGDPERRRQMGGRGRDWVGREFSLERVARETRDLIVSLRNGGMA